MISVYKDSTNKNVWIAQVQIGYYENGRPKYKRFKADTKKAALSKADDFLVETRNLAVVPKDADILLGDYIDLYINTYKVNSLKASSLTRDFGILQNQIKPRLGNLALNRVTTPLVQTFINQLVNDGYSYSTIHKAFTLLNEALNKAVQEERLLKNVCVGVVMPSKTLLKPKEITVLTEAEVRIFKEVALSRKHKNSLAILLILYTGLRCGELCGLMWKDIDFYNRVITVSRNVCVCNDNLGHRQVKLQDGTKTQLYRQIPINDSALELLRMIQSENQPKTSEDFIIQTLSPVPDVTTISKTYNRMLKFGGISGRTGIHTLRHTFASLLLEKGVDIKIVSEILGHSSVTFTYNTYIHLTPEQKSVALSLLHF